MPARDRAAALLNSRAPLLLPRTRSRTLAGMAIACIAPAAVTVAGQVSYSPVGTFPGTFMLLAVIAAALVGRLLAGIIAATFAFVGLAVVLIEPRGSLSLSGESIGALITFAVASVLVSHLLAGRDAALEAVEDSARRYRTLVERLPQITYACLQDRRLLYVSPQVESLLGCTIDEALGDDGFWERYVDAADLPRVAEAWDSWRAGPMAQPFRCEYRMLAEGGEIVWVADTAVRVRSTTGEQLHFEGSLRDESRERALEEQLRQSQKLEAIGTLAGGIAHDFNNLLGVISGYANVLARRETATAGERAWANEIAAAAGRGAALVRQLLAFSRRQVLDARALDLNDVLRGMEPMLRRLLGDDVELFVTAHPGLPAVLADRGQIEQVLLNLAVNARDAMPNGGRLTIETASVEPAEPPQEGLPRGPYVMLSVADTGSGIDTDTQSRIFEPFFTTKKAGSGLGLATVYGIVTQSGGTISVDSAPREGTTFRVFLPATRLRPEPDRRDELPTPAAGAGETVLLVEDEPMLRELSALLLTTAGYTVIAAEHGASALAIADQHEGRIDLLVTDVAMPGMNGPVLAEQLRSRRPEIKVLYVSGYYDQALAGRGIREHDRVVAKPFHENELLARVRDALRPPAR